MRDPNDANPTAQMASCSPYLLWLIWIMWLPFLYPAFLELFQAHPAVPVLVAYLAGITLFIAIYMWTTLRTARNLLAPSSLATYSPLMIWLPIAVLTVMSLALTPGFGKDWFDVFILTSACAAGCLRPRHAALVIATLAILVVLILTLRAKDFNAFDIGQTDIYVIVVGVVTMVFVRSFVTGRELRTAREEIARLAVTTERLRIARDLHDLLGHNLSLIALKSELAARLVKLAPERAAVEISDIEQVARTTLQEMREAVASYRQPTLASELHAAQELLAAAGIAYHYDGNEGIMGTLPPTVEAMLAWTMREGVTNVIRHSHARQCTIHLTRDTREVGVEIIDDGTSWSQVSALQPQGTLSSGGSGNGGNGLRGLAERVAALDGQYEAGFLPRGGFRLSVVVPVAEKSRDVGAPGTAEALSIQPRSAAIQSASADGGMQGRRKQL